MKEFKDLAFEPHVMAQHFRIFPFQSTNPFGDAEHARMYFENGYGVSVIIGELFYSNGIDTYEVAIIKNGSIAYDTGITDNVLGYLSECEVTEVMKQVQLLKE